MSSIIIVLRFTTSRRTTVGGSIDIVDVTLIACRLTATKPDTFPSEEEFAEMNKLAELVVRMLKELQRQIQPSASTPTFAHSMEGIQSTLDPSPSSQSAEPTRPPKRPWEDASAPSQSTFSENGGQPINLPEVSVLSPLKLRVLSTVSGPWASPGICLATVAPI